jgi:hypothetical protein
MESTTHWARKKKRTYFAGISLAWHYSCTKHSRSDDPIGGNTEGLINELHLCLLQNRGAFIICKTHWREKSWWCNDYSSSRFHLNSHLRLSFTSEWFFEIIYIIISILWWRNVDLGYKSTCQMTQQVAQDSDQRSASITWVTVPCFLTMYLLLSVGLWVSGNSCQSLLYQRAP